jgi:uncharacterized protein (DUF924 family)
MCCEMAVEHPRRPRAVIARFGRQPHRNAILGRANMPEELDYIAIGDFPHSTKFELPKVALQ